MATNERLVKRLISLRNAKEESRVKNLHTLLYEDTLWYTAYNNICGNKGAFTKGSDDSDTLDNFDKERVSKIIASLKDMSYQCKPSRRINIPKANGKTRPLSIPCGTDKLVQEACRIILEAVYEPKFSDSSHGFRPNRSCHTALKDIYTWSGTKWWIEFDIKGCFDNIDHNILITILNKRICDEKFIEIIRKFLNAGYVENFQYHKTYSGTPQGGIISPILANIYLSELDLYINNLCNIINSKKETRTVNEEYYQLRSSIRHKTESLESYKEKIKELDQYIGSHFARGLTSEIKDLIKEGYKYKEENNKNMVSSKAKSIALRLNLHRSDILRCFNYNDYKRKIVNLENEISELNLRKSESTNIRSRIFDDDFERLHYVRYADDFVLGYIGTRLGASEIYKSILTYLNNHLNLDISEEKSNIVFGSDGIVYLGYRIEMPKYNESRITYKTVNGTEVTRRRTFVKPVFKVPVDKAIKFVKKNGYGSYIECKSTHRTYLQNYDELEIVNQYNAELRGLYQYYKHAVNVNSILNRVQWLWQYSLLKTLGKKHRCSVAQVFKSKLITVVKDKITGLKSWNLNVNGITKTIFNNTSIGYQHIFESSNTDIVTDRMFETNISKRNSALLKLISDECEMCGIKKTETSIILHHPNQIHNIPKNIPEWERVRRIRNRKTIAVCHSCHMKLHHG